MKSKYEMYYGASSETLVKAKLLRKSETKSEQLMWAQLNSKKFYGFKFRRQHPISQFIVDFYCHELKLVIEVDGEIHNKLENKEYDENRTFELEKFELNVLRFTNNEVENNMGIVLKTIYDAISPPNRGIRGSQSVNQKPGGSFEV